MREARDNLILRLIGGRFGDAAQRGAELGVSFAVLSAKLLERFPGLHLLMVDRWELPARRPYRDPIGKRSTQALRRTRWSAEAATAFAGDRRTIVHADTLAAAAGIADGSLDWVLVDADHSQESALEDFEAWWPKVKPGGLILADDLDTELGRKWGWGVREALVEFCNRRGLAWQTAGEGVGVIEV